MHRAIFVMIAMLLCSMLSSTAFAADNILIPMDRVQTDHLKAYGVVYWVLSQGFNAEWLLNYRGGSFLVPASRLIELRCRMAGVSIEGVSAADREAILAVIANENMDVVLLEKAPRIAVYSPPNHNPWDDAVTLALEYAEIPHDNVWDPEIHAGALDDYDWLHLHHEDFSGQFGKFYGSFRDADWYQEQVRTYRLAARKAGFSSVQAHKGETARLISEYVQSGGFLFAMCSATDTLDVALAALGVDIVAPQISGTPIDPDYARKLDFTRTMAFENFELITSPYIYEYSNIDVSEYSNVSRPELEDFVLFEFSAKFDPVETMLTQNHVNEIKGFFGQTTSFRNSVIKPGVRILADMPGQDRSKYIHGVHGRGTFTFYGGHDPEDFTHLVGDPPTDLSLHRNSPGYRLILNNVLFPAARRQPRKT